MCNANNHPPGCTCGFGGDGHLGVSPGRPAGVTLTAPLVRVSFQPHQVTYTTLSSYTVPNARCPVCGDQVFFYASPYGGRVFFDDLGPPWPKHPCTDQSLPRLLPTRPEPPLPKQATLHAPHSALAHSTDTWLPLIVHRLEVHKEAGYTKLMGKFREQPIEMFVPQTRLPEQAPYYCKPAGSGKFSITTIHVTGTDQIHVMDSLAFSGLLDLHAHLKETKKAHVASPVLGNQARKVTVIKAVKKRPSSKRPHSPANQMSRKAAATTVMSLAFEKAKRGKS